MSTLRALSRFIGMVLFALAVIFAIGDIARYVADDVIRFSTIAEIAQTTGLGAGLFAGTSATAAGIGTWPFSITAAVVGSRPEAPGSRLTRRKPSQPEARRSRRSPVRHFGVAARRAPPERHPSSPIEGRP